MRKVVIRGWSPFGRYTPWRARREARIDAGKGLPLPGRTDPSGYPRELKQAAEQCFAAVVEEYHRLDRSLLQDLRDSQIRHRELEAESGVIGPKWAPEHLRARVPRIAAGVFALLVMIAEFPLNVKAFELWRESPLATYLVAFLLGFIIVLCSHLTGAYLKDPEVDSRQRGIMTASNLLVAVAVIGIAALRSAVLRDAGQGADAPFAAIFIGIQLFLYAVAVFLAYASHDPLHEHRQMLQSVESRRDRLAISRQKLFREAGHIAGQIKEDAQRLMGIYEQENLRRREDRDIEFPRVDFNDPTLPAGPLHDMEARADYSD